MNILGALKGRGLGLQGRMVRWHLLVLCAMTTLLVGVQTWQFYREARERIGERAVIISRLVAQLPLVYQGAERGEPNPALNTQVNALRDEAKADFIVVGNAQGIRLAHPVPESLGRPMMGGDNDAPLAGREIVSVARGSLGLSVRGKVPIWAGGRAGTRVVGVVSTGYLMPRAWNLVAQALISLLPWFLLAMALGTAGAVWAARRLRAEILNLEPEQIAALAQQQRAVLAALREGVIAVDGTGQVTLASQRAIELLGPVCTPAPLSELWPELAALTAGGLSTRQQNLELTLRGQPVLVNLEPLNGQNGAPDAMGGGFVSGFRDRAEALALADELTHARGFVDVLRAQTHEYQNRLHVLSGLLQLGRSEEALRVLNAEIQADAQFRQLLRDVQVPRLVALLAGKRERAQELGIDFHVAEGSCLSPLWERHADTLVTAVGNLTENAFEALAGQPGEVTVLIGEDPEGMQVEVEDSGPGVPAALAETLFTQGVSSKGEGRGYGLAGVCARIQALGGALRHSRRGGRTVFQVSLPAPGARSGGGP
ncbi:sensor histidine kinase [Deinococcus deserti]|uniref:histidine kinase n=1 Tax=Deinococcus deserti (strain DSM 17065 / CIP 109153 / LMG 22923 / VCD115) TaxID=546414 RepID=C1CWC8_DEIDV|nr:sensor histidine kinase [Deinococcus deserti]ACO46495.1 putative Signal transduction histidine kinase regulating citrate/malate metabolism; putative membrane protein [Deinococcus deserti VCD115]